MVKFGFAFAGLLSGLILSLVCFDQTVTEQPESALTWLRAVFIFIPIVGTSIAIFVMRNYDLTEQKAYEIRDALEARRGAAKNSLQEPEIITQPNVDYLSQNA